MSEREALCSIATSTCNISYFLQNRIKEPADHTILKAGMMARRKVKVISSASNGDSWKLPESGDFRNCDHFGPRSNSRSGAKEMLLILNLRFQEFVWNKFLLIPGFSSFRRRLTSHLSWGEGIKIWAFDICQISTKFTPQVPLATQLIPDHRIFGPDVQVIWTNMLR